MLRNGNTKFYFQLILPEKLDRYFLEKYLISLITIEYELHVCVLVSMPVFNPFHIPSGQISPIKENVLKGF
jgi:hypothetical protein